MWESERSLCQRGISGIGCGEALSDRLRGLIAVERGREIALSPKHVADVVVRDGEVALPGGISGIGCGEALYDRLRGLIAVERGRKIALSPKHTADRCYGRRRDRVCQPVFPGSVAARRSLIACAAL